MIWKSIKKLVLESSSDVDILYHLESSFFDKYSGFVGFKKLDEIKQYISKEIGKKVDLAPKNGLSNTAKKYILGDCIYV
jgi:predicted nucleotidyltransferase